MANFDFSTKPEVVFKIFKNGERYLLAILQSPYSEVPNNSRGANKSRGVPASRFLIIVGVLIKVGVQPCTKMIPPFTPVINRKRNIIFGLLDSKANT